MAAHTSHPNPRLPLRSLNPPSKHKPTNSSPFSLSRFLFKALFLVFLLLAVPLFPSQAPAFLDHRVFTEFWELLHLLFIGVAVSYGLFSRRNLDGDDEPENAERHASWSASRVRDFLPIFEDGYEFSCGSDGKIQRPVQDAWKCDSAHYSQGESEIAFSDECDFANEKQINVRSLSSENGGNVVSSWSSQCFQCEPMVVVAQPNFNLGDEYCKPLGLPVRSLRSRTGEGSRRKSRNGGGSGPVSGSGHSSISFDSRINGDFGEVGPVNLEKKFEGTVPVPSDSSIPWRSRSGRTEVRDSFGNVGKNLHARHISVEESQSRHHRSRSLRSNGSLTSHTGSVSSSPSPDKLSSHSASLDLPKMEDPWNKEDRFCSSLAAAPLDAYGSLDVSGHEKGMGRNLTDKDGYGEDVIRGSPDIKSTFYSSSMNRKASPDMSHSQKYEKILPENLNDERMDLSEKRSQKCSSDKLPARGSHSRSYTSIEKLNDERMDLGEKSSQEFSGGKLPPRGSHSRSYTTIDPFLDGDGQRKLMGDYEDLGQISRENLSHRRGLPQGSLKLDVKPRDKNIKGMLRGKSVRTFRASRRTETVDKFEENCRNFIDDKVGMMHEKSDQFHLTKEGNKTEGSHSCFGSAGEPSLGNSSPVLQQGFADCANGENNHCENKRANSGEEWMAEAENPRRTSDEEAVSGSFSDMGTEANEVDKKAGEFIAKFREQIRLQKMASIDGSVSIDISEDDYR
ncbi:uncharacterized protein LOC115726307 isoform X3 [Rhodamnia argentea]|uniref:Uncharacterized protein LOC115726307 isoform X2 n=1 Tax=Rhodamnia argentea TaxID=178133 RepID=A0ABM3H561_9MYRT|nr:uncharacterized protein LOC115726307 isoform X2 [Rhodamnia argentea]XP_048131746.1 uncharacterized protein LOC115726307 isoform X3 [Rhodamnia argentea]